MNRSILRFNILGVCCLLFGLPLIGRAQQDTVYTAADQMPYFPGCDQWDNQSQEKRACSDERLVSFIGDCLEYPDQARSEGIEGTVYVSFVIDAGGKVCHPSVLRDIGGACGSAALEVLEKMPPWQPALHRGQAVAVRLNLPIQFAFGANQDEQSGTYRIHWGMLKGNQISRIQLLQHEATPLQVRDAFGNDIPISELLFTYEKNRSYQDAKSNGKLTPAMQKVLRRARKGGGFSIVATIQKDGEFVYVERSLEIIE